MSEQAKGGQADEATGLSAGPEAAPASMDSASEAPPIAATEPNIGFKPLPEPPALDPAAVRTPGEEMARVATEAALEAVAASAAAQKMETLSGLVLDAAEVAHRAATTTTGAGHKLLETHTALEAELAKARKQSKLVLGVASGVSVLSLLVTAAIVTQVSSRMAQLDATVLAVGKRYVEMNAGLENLTVLSDSLAEMQAKQDAFEKLQARLTANLEEANKVSQGLVTQVPQATAKEVQSKTQSLVSQVQAIDARVQAQGAAVKKMADEFKAMQGQQDNVAGLKREVEALVVLQRERYLEAARATGGAAGATPKGPVVPPAPRTVQYPRPQPPAAEGGAASTAPAVTNTAPAAPAATASPVR